MTAAFPASRELVLDCLIEAPRSAVWRCWNDPQLLVQWFTPAPWSTKSATLDVRPGGDFTTVMADPEGKEFANTGVFLDVVDGEKLVFTDAYTTEWEPKENPFMTAIVTLAGEGQATRYRAVVRHFSETDRERHEAMGFHAGWALAAKQLEALAKTLT